MKFSQFNLVKFIKNFLELVLYTIVDCTYVLRRSLLKIVVENISKTLTICLK